MFGLSTREMLFKAILNASQNNISLYTNNLWSHREQILSILDENDSDKFSDYIVDLTKPYYQKVFDDVFQTLGVSSPTINERAKLAIMSPSLCGLDDKSIDDGVFIAGIVYAVCYWAITNKQAKEKDYWKISELQRDIMEKGRQETLNKIKNSRK